MELADTVFPRAQMQVPPVARVDDLPLWRVQPEVTGQPVHRDETPEETIRRLERRVAELEAVQAAPPSRREDLAELAMRGSNDGVWEWCPASKELFVAARLLWSLGFAEDTLRITAPGWLALIHPADRHACREAVTAHLRGRTPQFECEYRIADRTGALRWIASRGLAQRDADGRVGRVIGTLTDVTELKQREMGLRASEARFRSLIQTAASIILVLGPDGTVQEANREAERAFGLGRAAAIGRRWMEIIDRKSVV